MSSAEDGAGWLAFFRGRQNLFGEGSEGQQFAARGIEVLGHFREFVRQRVEHDRGAARQHTGSDRLNYTPKSHAIERPLTPRPWAWPALGKEEH